MFTMAFTAIVIMMISGIVMMLTSILSKKTYMDREKSSPFECSFDPKSLPFSLQCFLIAVIFLIFDVEIALLIPLISTMNISSTTSFLLIASFFLMILLIGFWWEAILIFDWNHLSTEKSPSEVVWPCQKDGREKCKKKPMSSRPSKMWHVETAKTVKKSGKKFRKMAAIADKKIKSKLHSQSWVLSKTMKNGRHFGSEILKNT